MKNFIHKPIIKICGMTRANNIREVLALKPDWMGFILHPDSPRYIDYTLLGSWIRQEENLFGSTRRTGVFVHHSPEEIVDIARTMRLKGIQLHGGQDISFGMKLYTLLRESQLPGIDLIKVFSIDRAFDFNRCKEWEEIADYFLFDTRVQGYGGSGKKFDWSILDKYRASLPFLLAGGIGPKDTHIIHHFIHPSFVGVDINSRFEKYPGIKDIEKLEYFIKAFRKQYS